MNLRCSLLARPGHVWSHVYLLADLVKLGARGLGNQ